MEDIKKKLQEEIAALEHELRTELPREISRARALGDLSENAEYHAAKERQGFIEGRSRDIESILAQAEIIDPGKLSGTKVVFGATVKLTDTDSSEEVTYTIVGDHEADIKAGRIAVSAPLARAIIGREQGEAVTLKTGKGTREDEISEVLLHAALLVATYKLYNGDRGRIQFGPQYEYLVRNTWRGVGGDPIKIVRAVS